MAASILLPYPRTMHARTKLTFRSTVKSNVPNHTVVYCTDQFLNINLLVNIFKPNKSYTYLSKGKTFREQCTNSAERCPDTKYIDQLALNTLSIFSFKIQIYFKANKPFVFGW